MSSKASSDPVDLEKGVTGLRKEEEEEPAVNTRKSLRIKLLLLDAIALFFVLFFVGFMAWAIMVSNTWWDSLSAILIIMLLILVVNLWLMAKMKKECMQGHATEEEASDDSDLLIRNNKLMKLAK